MKARTARSATALRRAPVYVVEALEAALMRLENLTAVGDREECSVADAAKAAVTPYLDSWVKPDLRAVLHWAKGQDDRTQRWPHECRRSYAEAVIVRREADERRRRNAARALP